MLRALLLASSLFLVCVPATADNVYVWRDANGVINYSDLPPVGGGVHVRKLRVQDYNTLEGESVARPLTQLGNSGRQSQSVAREGAGGGRPSEIGGSSGSGGTTGGGVASVGASRGGGSSSGGGGREGGGAPLAAGNSSASGTATTASGGAGEVVPISTAPAPDQAVTISTPRAPDRAVTISTAPAPDQAVPISTPTTATASATTAPPGVAATSGGGPGSSTWSQIASGSGGEAQATLYWDMVKAPNIAVIPNAGYRVYFGITSGSYFQPFGQGVEVGKVTSYTVKGLTPGTPYYFAVTTQVGGHESRYSNEASKVP